VDAASCARHAADLEDRGEAVGEVRHCIAKLGGKSGRMVERCVEFAPMTRIAYVVEEES
jgi:hypothetical protein